YSKYPDPPRGRMSGRRRASHVPGRCRLCRLTVGVGSVRPSTPRSPRAPPPRCSLRAPAARFSPAGRSSSVRARSSSDFSARFLARRMVYLTLAGTISSLAAGCALDALAPRGFKGETLGVLAAVACAAGIVSIRLLLAQQSPRGQEDSAPDWGDVARAVHDPR